MRGPRTSTAALKKLDSETLKKGKGEIERSTGKAGKKHTKDPDAPKRPPSAYIFFMQDFRNSFKENHPDNTSIMAISKAGGDKWKSMSVSEKAPYVQKAVKKKAEYEIVLEAYKKKLMSVKIPVRNPLLRSMMTPSRKPALRFVIAAGGLQYWILGIYSLREAFWEDFCYTSSSFLHLMYWSCGLTELFFVTLFLFSRRL